MNNKILLSIVFLLTVFSFSKIEAQETKTKTYDFKQFGDKYIVSIKTQSEIVKALTDFCTDQKIKAGTISGLGAINEVALRFFDPDTKKYVDKTFKEQLEITNLTGNISTMDGKEYLHLHITLGRSDYTALAGHLLSAKLRGAGEFVIDTVDGKVERTFCPALGLNLYDFEKE